MINRYLNATGPFLPQTIANAAIKLAIASILDRRDFKWVAYLIDEGGIYNEFEGEPGWVINRRDPSRWDNSEFQGWPSDAVYRAWVDPEEFQLKFPEYFMDKRQFLSELLAQVKVFLQEFPSDSVAFEISKNIESRM